MGQLINGTTETNISSRLAADGAAINIHVTREGEIATTNKPMNKASKIN